MCRRHFRPRYWEAPRGLFATILTVFLFCASPDKLTIYKPLLNGEPRFGFPPLSTLFNHARENIRRYAQDGYSSNAELFAVSQSTCSKFWIYLKNTMRILTHFLTANGAMERCDRSLWRICSQRG